MDDEELQLNLTPLLDVLFVLLCLFMVTTPYLFLETIDITKGIYTQTKRNSPSRLTVIIDSQNRLQINHKYLNQEEAAKTLKEFYKRDPKSIPIILPDAKANYGMYQSTKNLLQEVGFKKVHVVHKKH